MIKRDIVLKISEETGLVQADVAVVVQRTLDHIVESLQRGENVELRKFGVFEVQKRKPRVGRNPMQPDATVVIPERKVVKFKPGKIMKETITKPV